MKKLMLFFLIFIITGCSNDDVKVTNNDYDNEYYKIYESYQKPILNNYSVRNINNLDMEEVELMLMELSKKYFNINKLYYQNGSYLIESDLKELLNKENLNNYKEEQFGNIIINPYLISTIYEQNYVDNNGNLNGISLAIVVNPYQPYKNSYGSTLYKEFDLDYVIEEGKKSSETLLKYIRDKYNLKGTKIMVAIFVQSNPFGILPGTYKAYGVTNDNNVDFKALNHNYYDLDKISEIDMDNYTAYRYLKDKVNEIFDNIYISGYGLYDDKGSLKMIISLTYNNINKSNLLYLNKIISEDVLKKFTNDTNIRVYIKNNNKLNSLLFKKKGEISNTIYLLD